MPIKLRLKQLRQEAKNTQTELAALLGVSREAYSMYEMGKRQMGFEALDILAAHYRVTADYLLGRTAQPAAGELLTDAERALLTQYRALDSRGRHAVAGVAALQAAFLAGEDA